MTKIFLIRHGETDWNRQDRWLGQTDTPLNNQGLAQAHRTAERLAAEPITAIYSSDLIRAAQTAKIIANRFGRTVSLLKELRELDFGEWEGKSAEEIGQLFPQEYALSQTPSWEFRPRGGESRRELYARVTSKVEEILAQHVNETIAIVTHGGPCRMLIEYILSSYREDPSYICTFRAFEFDNCGVTVLSRDDDGRFKIISLNETYHLKGLQAG